MSIINLKYFNVPRNAPTFEHMWQLYSPEKSIDKTAVTFNLSNRWRWVIDFTVRPCTYLQWASGTHLIGLECFPAPVQKWRELYICIRKCNLTPVYRPLYSGWHRPKLKFAHTRLWSTDETCGRYTSTSAVSLHGFTLQTPCEEWMKEQTSLEPMSVTCEVL